jgi:2-polyprenyl-3-methyl-5-hydroxy-6-metoxy-1,4-benzoquinol methylase
VKSLDVYLRNVRIAKARRYTRPNDVVLDIGCADGAMFEQWRGLIKYGVGVEPTLTETRRTDLYELRPGFFPDALDPGQTFDVVTMLAVLEHIQPEEQAKLAEALYRRLNPGGRVVITVPSPKVDDILHVLDRLHLIDGMEMHEHYGFEPADTERLFQPPHFRLVKKQRFQLGLNNLYVFEKV